MPVSAESDDVRLYQSTGGRLHAPGFLLGITFEPKLSRYSPFSEDLCDAANDPRIMLGIAGPLFGSGIGKEFADLRLRIREDDQTGVHAGEKTAEPFPGRIAIADCVSKACAFGLAQVVRRKPVEDRAAAQKIPIDVGRGEAAGLRDVRHPDFAIAVDSEKSFCFEEDVRGLVLGVTWQSAVQSWVRTTLAHRLHSDRASRAAKRRSGDVWRAGNPRRPWVPASSLR